MKNFLNLDVLHKIPEYNYGKPKNSMRKIKDIMREMEYDEDSIINVNEDFCQGFGVAREIISDLLWNKYWEANDVSETAKMKFIDDFFDSISIEDFEKIAINAGALDLNKNAESEEKQNIGLCSNEGIDNASFTGFNTEDMQWNRWYVNEEMLPRLQDTVLICKGWYNKKKYKNEYEALRAYWASIAMMDVEDVGYDVVLQCLLLPACEAFLCNRKFCEIFYDKIFKQDIMMRDFERFQKHKEKAEYREMDTAYLIELLTGALFRLKNDEFYFEKRPADGYCVV